MTVLFIALWGRAVVVDADALAESLTPLGDTAVVSEFFGDWLAGEVAETSASPEVADEAVGLVLESTATASAMDSLASEVVRAAASSDPAGSSVDVASLLAPTVPEVTTGLSGAGLSVSQGEVATIVAGLDPLVVREAGSPALVGPESPAAARLGTAALLGVLGMVVFGYASVVASDDRIAAVRGLFSRVAVGGLGFAILLLIGAWITDPAGGRAPVPETISAIASSKWLVPMQVGLAAGVVAVSIYFVRRRFRPGEASHPTDGPPTPPEEQPLSLSGRR